MDVIVELYAPIFSAMALMLFALKSRFGDEKVLTIQKFGFEISITRTIAGRTAFLVGIITSLSYYIYFDCSKFFPSNLEMEVFYDQNGLQKSLDVFSEGELLRLGYRGNTMSAASIYYRALDEQLRESLKFKGFFSLADGVVHSEGETTFKVEKTPGVHNYYVSQSGGKLTHVLEVPGQPAVKFISFFEKLPSESDYIRPTLTEMFLDHSIVISPRFKQILAEKNISDGVIFNHKLVGATKVYLFPYPKFSNTVYFFESKADGLVPIAYAVYK